MDRIKIGIDIDGCINADEISKEFFKILTHLLGPGHDIYIISNRDADTLEETIEELDEIGIQYHHLVLTGEKAEYVLKHNITVLFENEDEYFLELGEEVTVFKIRENLNFNFDTHKWVGSTRTTEMIDEKE